MTPKGLVPAPRICHSPQETRGIAAWCPPPPPATTMSSTKTETKPRFPDPSPIHNHHAIDFTTTKKPDDIPRDVIRGNIKQSNSPPYPHMADLKCPANDIMTPKVADFYRSETKTRETVIKRPFSPVKRSANPLESDYAKKMRGHDECTPADRLFRDNIFMPPHLKNPDFSPELFKTNPLRPHHQGPMLPVERLRGMSNPFLFTCWKTTRCSQFQASDQSRRRKSKTFLTFWVDPYHLFHSRALTTPWCQCITDLTQECSPSEERIPVWTLSTCTTLQAHQLFQAHQHQPASLDTKKSFRLPPSVSPHQNQVSRRC